MDLQKFANEASIRFPDPTKTLNDYIVPLKQYVWCIDELGRIISVCDNAANLVGANPAEVVGSLDGEVFSSGIFQVLRTLESRVLVTGKPLEDHLARYLSDSPRVVNKKEQFGVYWLVSSTPWQSQAPNEAVSGILRIARDVTPVASSISNAFDESYSDLLAESINSSSDISQRRAGKPAIEYVHDLNGFFLEMNLFGMEVFQLDEESLVKLNILDVLSRRHWKRMGRSIKNKFEDVNPEHPLIFRARKRDGSTVWIEIIANKKSLNGVEIVKGTGWIVSLPWLSDLHRNNRIIEGGKIAAWDRELVSNRFFASDEWKRQIGLPRNSPVSYYDFIDRVHETDKLRVRREFASHLKGTKDHYEVCYRIKHIDGSWRWLQAVGRISTGIGGVKYISGQNIDVTGEFANAKDLSDSESLFNAIVQSDPAMIFVKNRAGQFVFANDALCKFYNTNIEELMGKSDEWFYRSSLDQDYVEKQLRKFKEYDDKVIHGSARHVESLVEEIVPPGGKVEDARYFSTVKICVEFDNEPFVVGISSDVTRIELEKEMYQDLLQFAPAAMFIKSSDGRYGFTNKKFAELLGVDESELKGAMASDFLDEESAGETEISDENCLYGHTEFSRTRTIGLLSGIEKRIVSSKKTHRVLNENQEFEYKLIGCDIDETATRDQTYVELLDSLLVSLKHDYVCRFLQKIQGDLEQFEGHEDMNGQIRKWKQMLQFSQDFINRLEWLAPNIAEIGKVVSVEGYPNHEKVDLQRVLSDACDLANMLNEFPHCKLATKASMVLKCEPTILSNVVFNFLSNSKKFTLGREKKKKDVLVDFEVVEGHIKIWVDDGGAGISIHANPMVLYEKGEAYDPAPEADLDVKGSGIGLYFNRVMIEQILGGSVEVPVASERGGALFAFKIPVFPNVIVSNEEE